MTYRDPGGERHAPPTPVSLAAGLPVHAHVHPHHRADRRGGDLPRPAGRRPRTRTGARVWRGIGAIPLSGPESPREPAGPGATTDPVSAAGPRGEGAPRAAAGDARSRDSPRAAAVRRGPPSATRVGGAVGRPADNGW